MRAVRVHRPGGPEVLTVEELPDPTPGPGQVRVRVAAAGVNFIDVYHRTGLYPMALPATIGVEGAGEVDAVGDGVTWLQPGDRVAWAGVPGSYAELAVLPADRVVRVPDEVDPLDAAAVMLQGMTAHYLATDTFPLSSGHTAVVLAAAGGVGHLLVQIASRRGARVIAVASTEDKRRLAAQLGADATLAYEELPDGVRELTDGRGADVVYDSVGQATFAASLDSLRVRGLLALYGQSSGPVAPIDPQILNEKGSLFLTRPSLFHYTAERAELERRARDLFTWLAEGSLQVRIGGRWLLDEVADAHRALESRTTIGKLLLIP